MSQDNKQDSKRRFSIKNTIEKSRIALQAFEGKSSNNREFLILILVHLPIVLGFIAFLGGL